MLSATSYLCPKNERQQSVNHCRPCIVVNQGAVRWHWSIIELSATSLGKSVFHNIVPMPQKWASTEHQQYWAFHLRKSTGCVTRLFCSGTMGRLSRQKCLQQHRNYVLKWVSTEHQWSVNDFWSCILDNLKAMGRGKPTINLSATLLWQKY